MWLQVITALISGGTLLAAGRITFQLGRLYQRFEGLELRVAAVEVQVAHPERFCRMAPRPAMNECEGGD